MADKFEYKHNAPTQDERKEINSILEEYLPTDEKQNKLQYLKKINYKVKRTPTILGLSFGIVGILVFGFGLTWILEWDSLLDGCIYCVLGGFLTGFAYPIYSIIYKKLKNKYSSEIIKLSKELLNMEEI